MNSIVTSAATPKAGLCPHGLPPSACPICSNMGGGGGKKIELNFKSAPPQMMSWSQCEAIGYFLKGLKRSQENNREALKTLTQNLAIQAANFSKLAARLESLAKIFNNNPIGVLITIPIKIILLPAVRLLQTSFTKLVDITDKIAAIIGELKKGLEKARENILKFINETKNKFFKLFEIFGVNNSDNKEKQVEEDKRIFNINKFFKIITNKTKKRDKNEAGT